MCVIAYKQKDVRFPSEERVRKMWEKNPDGAGVMWRDPDTNRIRFVKGFMKLKKLEEWIAENRKWLENVECALHFRITTHGGTSQGNCHPFVIDSETDSHLLSGESNYVLMHNGILNIKPRKNDISDSAELALRLAEFSDPIHAMNSFTEQFEGNRIIVMGPEETKSFGDAFQESSDKDGILYSNLHWDTKGISYSCGYNIDDAGWWNPKNEEKSEKIGAVYDRTLMKWVNPLDNSTIPIEEVDPDFLSEEDYEEYELELYNEGYWRAFHSGLVKDDDDFDRLEEEAFENGMDVNEYLEYMGVTA